jgi:hypothetical protein
MQSVGHGAYGAPNKANILPLSQWRLLAVQSVMKIGEFARGILDADDVNKNGCDKVISMDISPFISQKYMRFSQIVLNFNTADI